jgi:hypothetical protein
MKRFLLVALMAVSLGATAMATTGGFATENNPDAGWDHNLGIEQPIEDGKDKPERPERPAKPSNPIEKPDNTAPERPIEVSPENPIETPATPENPIEGTPENPIETPNPVNPIEPAPSTPDYGSQISDVNQRLSDTRSEMKGIGAQAGAMTASAVSATAQLEEAGDIAIGVGYGSYSDASAQSFTLAGLVTDNVNINASWSHADGNSDMFSVGAGYKFNFKK